MCRFLLVTSREPIDAKALLTAFADMAEKSRAPDGDMQKDGWGVAWKTDTGWNTYTSLKPVWEDREQFSNIPSGTVLAVHARSASFADQIGVLEYNQPYVKNDLCFVFNGVLKGVKTDRPLEGKIGAQKIFSLVQQEKQNGSADSTLKTVNAYIREHTREVVGLNVGLITNEGIAAMCDYKDNRSYFGIHWYTDRTMSMICSEPLHGFTWTQMQKGETVSF